MRLTLYQHSFVMIVLLVIFTPISARFDYYRTEKKGKNLRFIGDKWSSSLIRKANRGRFSADGGLKMVKTAFFKNIDS